MPMRISQRNANRQQKHQSPVRLKVLVGVVQRRIFPVAEVLTLDALGVFRVTT